MIQLPRGILLTGATGLLGRYLLKDLLAAGCQVAVLVRDSHSAAATDRVAALVEWCRRSLGCRVAAPAVVPGDIQEDGLGLGPVDRRWLSLNCDAIVHAAANLSFSPNSNGEPCATNVEGTSRLLGLCRRLGISEFHHVSTAFVCGETTGPVFEDAITPHPRFRNIYEQSKFEAERLVRDARGIRSTIYRPSVIVGDSRTGYTSTYHGIYRFIELIARLSAAVGSGASNRRRLNLRLPFTGNELRNLVPVDWVARAIVHLVNRPECHGRTYHLVSAQPTPVRLIKEVTEQLFKLDGLEFAGPEIFEKSSPLERIFLNNLEEYWPYLRSDPDFDYRNLVSRLPQLPSVPIDRALIARLIRFGIADGWGRKRRTDKLVARSNRVDCRQFMEEIFPQRARQSPLGRAAGLNLAVGIDVRGHGGGQWTLEWSAGELAVVRKGLAECMEIVYHIDEDTFDDLIGGRQTPPEAFFARRIEVDGDLEKALKLAVLFGQFLHESQNQSLRNKEVADVAVGVI